MERVGNQREVVAAVMFENMRDDSQNCASVNAAMKNSAKLGLGVCVLMLVGSIRAWGGITTVTDEALFKGSLLPGYYQEDFATWKFSPPTPLAGNVKDYASAPGFYQWQAHSDSYLFSLDKAISIADGGDGTGILTITFSDTPGWQKVTGIGGNFFASDFDGNPSLVGGTNGLTIHLSDGTVVRVNDSALTPFRGLISDVPITSLSIQFTGFIPEGDSRFPSLGELIIGTVPDSDFAYATPVALAAVCLVLGRRFRSKPAQA